MTGHCRKVRFADGEALSETLCFNEDLTVPLEEIWYNGDDYAEMKARSRSDAKLWRRQGFDVLLRDTFQFPLPEAQEYINAFVMLEECQSRRGLERFLSRQHGEERSAMKDRARYTVLVHQRQLRKSGAKADEMSEKLSDVYKEISRSALVFARRLAIADELVVLKGENNRFAEKILEAHHVAKNGQRKMERRLSNFSIRSGSSFDSKRRWNPRQCPSSPASHSEELYAAIA